VPEFKTFTAEQQEEFYRNIADVKNVEQMAKETAHFFEQRREEANVSKVGGQYMPLSWYGRQGFDTKRIKQHCTDTKEHAVLGLTYRVKIEYAGQHVTEAGIRKDNMEARAQRGRAASRSRSGQRQGGAPSRSSSPHKATKKTRKRSSSSSSSSSSESSKSRRKQKKAKGKKKKKTSKKRKGKKSKKRSKSSSSGSTSSSSSSTPRSDSVADVTTEKEDKRIKAEQAAAVKAEKEEQKRQKAEQAAAEKADKQRRGRSKTQAMKTVSKISPELMYIEMLVADPLTDTVPAFALNAAKKSRDELKSLRNEAQASIKAEALDYSIDTVALDMDCKQARERATNLANMLQMSRKHHGV